LHYHLCPSIILFVIPFILFSFFFFFNDPPTTDIYTLSLHDALPGAPAMNRTATVERATRETGVRVTLVIDGTGRTEVSTGIGFLDHLFDALGRHSGFDLTITCKGDLRVDDHHTAEDCALGVGEA